MAGLIMGIGTLVSYSYTKGKEARNRHKAKKADARVDALTAPVDDEYNHGKTGAGPASNAARNETPTQENGTTLERTSSEIAAENADKKPPPYDTGLGTGEEVKKKRMIGIGRKKDKSDGIIR